MHREYVHLDNGRVTWSQAVGRVADALNPLGAAARIVAELSACVVEFRQLEIQRQTVQAQRDVLMQALLNREKVVGGLLLQRDQQRHEVSCTLSALREGFNRATVSLSDQFIAQDERMLFHGTVQALTMGLATIHREQSNSLIQLSRVFLVDEPVIRNARRLQLGQ